MIWSSSVRARPAPLEIPTAIPICGILPRPCFPPFSPERDVVSGDAASRRGRERPRRQQVGAVGARCARDAVLESKDAPRDLCTGPPPVMFGNRWPYLRVKNDALKNL